MWGFPLLLKNLLFNEFAFVVVIYVDKSKLIVLVVRVNGDENVNEFSFVVNKVAVDTFKFDMLVVCPFINNIDADENVFKLFVNPEIDRYDVLDKVFKLLNIVVVVAVKLDIDVVCPVPNEDELDKLFKLFVNPDIDKYVVDEILLRLVNIVFVVDVKFDMLVKPCCVSINC